ncbi:MAG: signal peptidase I [Actinobacteria bacterium]|nr:signal peptidase I [Actinomycetota bacterium]
MTADPLVTDPSDRRARSDSGAREWSAANGRGRHRAPGGVRARARRRARLRGLVTWLTVLILAGFAAIVLRTWVVAPYWIPSESMEPTLHGCAGCQPDRLLVDKLSYHLHAVRRGDVIVFNRPPALAQNDPHLVKRVIGLAGESVSGHGGAVYVEDQRLVEPYVNPVCHGTGDFGPVVVPRGDVFVMGDNRCDSLDSRSFGPIPESTIVGRAFLTVWPLGRLHWL